MSDIHEILVAVDFSDGSNAALDHAALVAERLGANIHVLHVWQLPAPFDSLTNVAESHAKQELELFVKAARERGVPVRHSFTELGVPSTTIVNVATRQKYDLIVLGTHGRTGVAHAVLGSVAERVVRRAPCPVLTVRAPAKPRAPELRRVLVPVDYSEGSRRALDYATSLAAAAKAELDVVHVWDRPSYVSEDVVVHGPADTRRSLGELIRENAEQQMEEFLASAFDAGTPKTSGRPSHRLLSGEPASTLIAELEKGAHDLVVIGTHGRTGVKHFLLGSIAEKLVRYSTVPVIAVPPGWARPR
jgi:nucleotide-binding universal stress UspA family protein